MDILRAIDARMGRWLAYADYCLGEGEAARCQGFWAFVAAVLGVICVAALIAVAVKLVLDRRRTGKLLEGEKYRRLS